LTIQFRVYLLRSQGNGSDSDACGRDIRFDEHGHDLSTNVRQGSVANAPRDPPLFRRLEKGAGFEKLIRITDTTIAKREENWWSMASPLNQRL
jgi:hypothetical protein